MFERRLDAYGLPEPDRIGQEARMGMLREAYAASGSETPWSEVDPVVRHAWYVGMLPMPGSSTERTTSLTGA